MAEPDAAHPSPYRLSVRKIPRDPFAEGMREMERATAPLRAIHEAVELATEPLRKSAEATQMAMEAGGFGRDLRQLFGEVVLAPRATVAKPAPAIGPNGPIGPDSRHPAAPPSAPDPATAHPQLALNASPEAMDALVQRVAEAVVTRLANPLANPHHPAHPNPHPHPHPQPQPQPQPHPRHRPRHRHRHQSGREEGPARPATSGDLRGWGGCGPRSPRGSGSKRPGVSG